MTHPARSPAAVGLLLTGASISIPLTLVAPVAGVALALAAVIVAALPIAPLGNARWIVVGGCAAALVISAALVVTAYDIVPDDTCAAQGCEEQHDVTPEP